MRFFLADRAGEGMEELTPILRFRRVPYGMEFETRRDDGANVVRYIVQRDKSSVYLACCWSQCFDGVHHLVLAQPALAREMADKLPIMTLLLHNGAKRAYSEGTIVQLAGEEGAPYWCVATVVGNIDPDDPRTWGNRVENAEELVTTLSLALTMELAKRPSETFKFVTDAMQQNFERFAPRLLLRSTSLEAQQSIVLTAIAPLRRWRG